VTDVPDTEQGIAGTVLVIVIAWALAAVLMLTVTLVAAQDIEETVGEITEPEEGSVLNAVYGIDGDLGPVALATAIERTSSDILTAAKPLEEQLDQVLVATDSIDASARSILSTAGDIDNTVNSIDGTVDSIHSRLGGTDEHVSGSINPGLRRASQQSVDALALVESIGADVGAILVQVQEREPTNDGIKGHAHSIDCRVLGENCERGPGAPGAPIGDLLDVVEGGGGGG
jgi:hypothetical protein